MAMYQVSCITKQKVRTRTDTEYRDSVWHPLRGPLVDWPLAVCDASSVDFSTDTMPGDLIDRVEVFENMQVHYSPQQRWYWLPDQLPSELLIFKNSDSRSLDGTA